MPLCMYGDVIAMLRKEDVLNLPISSALPLTIDLPLSFKFFPLNNPIFRNSFAVKSDPKWHLTQLPFPLNKAKPLFTAALTAVESSENFQLSKGLSPVSNVRSNAAIAAERFALDASLLKASLKYATYFLLCCRRYTASSTGKFISFGFAIGANACSSS